MAKGKGGNLSQSSGPLLIGLLMVVVSLGVLIWQARWVRSAIAGPVPITAAELRQLDNPAKLDNPWVVYTFDNALDTKLGIAEQRGGVETPRTHYLLTQVQDRWLVTEVPHNFQGQQVTGYLDVWSAPLRKEALEKIGAAMPAQKPLLLPFQLDAEYGYRSQCWAMLGLCGFFFLGGLAMVGYGVKDLMAS